MDKVTVSDTIKRAIIVGGDNFTGVLIGLIAKADPQNRARLKLGFPVEVLAWEGWQQDADGQVPDFVVLEN